MKVKATAEYEKMNLEDAELKRILKKGEIFEVSKERFEILNGKNKYNKVFVEKVIEIEETEDILSDKKSKKSK